MMGGDASTTVHDFVKFPITFGDDHYVGMQELSSQWICVVLIALYNIIPRGFAAKTFPRITGVWQRVCVCTKSFRWCTVILDVSSLRCFYFCF